MHLTGPRVEWRDQAVATYGHDVSPKKPTEPGQVGTLRPTAPLRAEAEAQEIAQALRGCWDSRLWRPELSRENSKDASAATWDRPHGSTSGRSLLRVAFQLSPQGSSYVAPSWTLLVSQLNDTE